VVKRILLIKDKYKKEKGIEELIKDKNKSATIPIVPVFLHIFLNCYVLQQNSKKKCNYWFGLFSLIILHICFSAFAPQRSAAIH